MNLLENIKVALGAIRENMLRTVLTALIIAIGIMALVGILTAVDGIQASINDSFSDLGANSFNIGQKFTKGSRSRGMRESITTPISYYQAQEFKKKLSFSGIIGISVGVSFNTEVKQGSKTTNPNSQVIGVDENYLGLNGLELKMGRNFMESEIINGIPVVIIGNEIAEKLFSKTSPLNRFVNFLGKRYQVIGVLNSQGGNMGGNAGDRTVLIPLENARTLLKNENTSFDIKVKVSNPAEIDQVMSEARGLMRKIRHDLPGKDDSFEINKSETLAERLDEISKYLKIGGFVIGFITLLGASVGLMNIMLVSVTERTREIGIRKALGATPRRIQEQFLVEAIVICQLGGIAGIFLGILAGNGVAYLLGSHKFIVPWLWMFLGVVICVIVGVISGFYPSYKASQLDPIEALRFE
ncbi:MAG: ABC transporter permease [Raineya sp.]|nr:ABC transporter permease [Raineya sp.]MDW8295697.1 ABC transporter permease [Raineya sp.]